MSQRFKLDENLPASLQHRLLALGFDVDTAREEGLDGQPDARVMHAAAEARRIVVTQDLDYADLRRSDVASSTGIVVVRLSDPESGRLVARIEAALREGMVNEWPGNLVIITDDRVRIRPLR